MQIGEYLLDRQQEEIVKDESDYLLVVAGAGSGKTLTIMGKINYLIKEKNIDPTSIICISFTRASSNSLKEKIKEKLNYDIDVYTFHKLALNILRKEINFDIADSNTLENIIDLFFRETIYHYPKHLKLIEKYFKTDNYQKYYQTNYKNVIALEKLISTFIHLMKSNNYTLDMFPIFLKKIKKIFNFNYRKEKIFLIMTLNIYLIYSEYLNDNNELDFDDLLVKATDFVYRKDFYKKVKYIIIDEYQDTSLIRFKLVLSILNKTNSKLMVVGDDFQSIYRFTGCDLDLFVNFDKYFKDSKVLKIENTYRNSRELINVAGNFIMKNKEQIKKNLSSEKVLDKPIEIYFYDNAKTSFLNLVLKIYNETKKPILILGRNNNDIYEFINKDFSLKDNRLIYLKNRNIKITYLTIHKSKGLEEENTIIINLKDDILGLPSKIKEDRILRLLVNSKKYLYDEERRLFYVALTRTKNKCYLLVPKDKGSIFVHEIMKNYKNDIKKGDKIRHV